MSDQAAEPNALVQAEALHAARLWHRQRWIGPLGTVACATMMAWLLRDHVDRDRLLVWMTAVVAMSAQAALAFLVRPLRRRRSRRLLPVFTELSHLGIGVTAGLLGFIDHSAMVDDPAVLLGVLAYLFVMTLGVAIGTAATGPLLPMVAVPLWLLTGAAMISVSQWLVTAVLAVGAALLVHGQWEMRRIWRELVHLRLESSREADRRRHEADCDPLTKLWNRRGAIRQVEERKLEQAGASWLVAFFIDLDRFKPVNDTYGHAIGDHVLVETARRLAEVFRPDDVVARIGGDEFVAILRAAEAPDQSSLGHRADHLIDMIERPVLVDGHELTVSASVGIAWEPLAEADCEALIQWADRAMYEAKRSDDPAVKIVVTSSGQRQEAWPAPSD